MAFNFKKEEDVKDYLKNLHTQYSFGCYSEKSPEACHLLGDYSEAVEKDFVKSAKLYKLSCDEYNYARSCHSYASHTLTGKGVEKENPPEAQTYFTKGCELDNAESCCNAGVMALSGFTGRPEQYNEEKGLEMLDKGCRSGSANACLYMSSHFIAAANERDTAQNMRKASEYATLGCELRNAYACANLSLMYRNGEGVEKNAEISEQYKKKALELQKEYNDNLTLNYQRGLENNR